MGGFMRVHSRSFYLPSSQREVNLPVHLANIPYYKVMEEELLPFTETVMVTPSAVPNAAGC